MESRNRQPMPALRLGRVVNGQVVGADPDANVRLQLLRDADTPSTDD